MASLFSYRLSGRSVANDARYRAACERYDHHLASVDPEAAGDLLRFFGHDFFHDGRISRLAFVNGNRDLKMRTKAWFDLPPAAGLPDSLEFDVQFKDVVWQTLEHSVETLGPRVYLYSEVDGLTRRIDTARKRYGGEFHSLAVECYEGWIAAVFRRAIVTPRDCAAWDAVLARHSSDLALYPSD